MRKLHFNSIFLLFILLLLFSPLVSSCTTSPEASKTLKIGLITSVTGPMAAGFQPVYDGAKPAAEIINKNGGITVGGQKYNIEILVEDDQSTPPGAISAANRLLQQDIKFIIAPTFIPSNKAIESMCEEAKVIRVAQMAVDPTLFGPQYPYSFCSCLTLYYAKPVYDYLADNYPDAKKIALLTVDDPGAIAPTEIVQKEIENHGMELVFNENFTHTTEDFYPIVTNALKNNPDAIGMVLTMPPWAKSIVDASRDMGFTGPIYCSTPMGDINLVNSLVRPNYAYDIFAAEPDVLSSKMKSMVQDHRKLVEDATGGQYVMSALMPLMAGYPLVQAIEEAQSFDTDKVVATWENMNSIDTVFGKGEMGGSDIVGNNHIVISDIPLSYIDGGEVKFEFLKYQ